MQEQRKSKRVRTFLGGKIMLNGRGAAMYGMIRDISETGAKLVFPSIPGVPDRFELHIQGKGLAYEAQVAWRRGKAIGVAFVGTRPLILPYLRGQA